MKHIPAFPTETAFGYEFGMTLRDYFAAKAMQEFCKEFDDNDHIARTAYAIADAMLKARNKQ